MAEEGTTELEKTSVSGEEAAPPPEASPPPEPAPSPTPAPSHGDGVTPDPQTSSNRGGNKKEVKIKVFLLDGTDTTITCQVYTFVFVYVIFVTLTCRVSWVGVPPEVAQFSLEK